MSLCLIALESNINCPIWQPEKMAVKLNRSSCFVKFCWLGIIAQARVKIVEVAAGSLGRVAFADRLVWLLDSGKMREH